jgi:energy-coupling factor transporter ATP-binding protein EcfA2
MPSLEQTLRAAKTLRDGLSRIAPPPGFPHPVSPVHAIEGLLNLERRIGEGRTAPVRVALFGPTGAGKSKLFNSLLGEMASPASYRRPFTRRPVYYLHRARKEIARSLRGDVKLHERSGWEDRILIDSPDFDSVEAENRALAAQVYLEADAFIFVADVHKYADASTWSYLARLRAEGKASAFVLNKLAKEDGACGPGVAGTLEDYRARLEKLFRPGRLPGPLIAIADLPAPDEDPIPADEPGLAQLHEAIDGFATPGRGGGATLLAESLRIDLRRFLSEWDRFATPLREYREGIDRLAKEIDGAFAREAEDLRRDLQAEIDPALKGEVYREVLRRIERIDVLRYPRRLLALPALGVKTLVGRLWTRIRPARNAVDEERAAGDAMNLAILEGRLGSLAEAVRRAARAEAACPGLLGDEDYRALRPDHETASGRYRQSLSEFRAWAEEKARTTASALTTENKAKFILSQIIYNTVVIGVQVKTAGTLTLTEMFTDGILSPLVAKIVGIAVSSERVREFEDEARREFSARLVEVLREVRDRFTAHLFASIRDLEGIDRVAGEVEALRGAADDLVRRFQEGEG